MQTVFPNQTKTPAPQSFGWEVAHTNTTSATVPTYVYAVVFASFCIVMGLLWDIMWHMSIGRDGLFSAPHLVIYVGALVSGLFSGYQILSMTFQKNHPDRPRSVRFWGIFYGSLGAMFCVWGALAMLTSAPFDDWWHNTYGLDVKILTPPHSVLAAGIMMAQFGAMIGVLALQNTTSERSNPLLAARSRVLFVLAAGFLLTILYVLMSESLSRLASHHTSYYTIAAIIFPIFLMAVGRSSAVRYPITAVAAVYMVCLLLPSWVLQFIPATPKLGPVLNPITHYQTFFFPLLLVIPAFALDVVNRRFANRLNDWWLAAIAGLVFLLVLLAVQWPFGAFLVESPYARNGFFLSESLPYNRDPNGEFRYKFNPRFYQTTLQFALGFGKALLIAMVSARIGLWWGSWMKRVVR
jgi:cytochrome bd-type quinol oxidase subunit 2